jgi:RNA polymerase sigma-70 factor (ECF subfamily)
MMKGVSLDDVLKYHMDDIYHYLLKLSGHPQTAEDLLQDTLIKAFEHLESYHGEKVRPWLFKVAHNIYVDWYRREKRQIPTDPDLLAGLRRTVAAEPEEALLQREKIESWLAALQLLSEKSRQVLILRDYHGFSYQEIADILDLSLANVKVTLYRARTTIREVMKDEL